MSESDSSDSSGPPPGKRAGRRGAAATESDSPVAALRRGVSRVDFDAAPRPRRRRRAAGPVSESGGHFDAADVAAAPLVPPRRAVTESGGAGLGTAAARGVLAASASGVPAPLAAFSEASTVRAPAPGGRGVLAASASEALRATSLRPRRCAPPRPPT
ncbi:hypothetical protein M885DRAFT_544958 [Pelagophyceae sp. CCMP2097]|nr:hypothetical protein M885DRAFT_544958 [Pelagophyceae sp. CCMP2097]